MTRSSRFAFLLAAQLCVPAAIYLLVGLYNGRGIGLEYLLPNYLIMAAPHLLVALLAIWPRARRPALLWVLSLLNALLAAFQVWVLLGVPGNESGMAWLFYFPLSMFALLACAIAWDLGRRNGAVAVERASTDVR